MSRFFFSFLALLLGFLPGDTFAGSPDSNQGLPAKGILHKQTSLFVDLEVPSENVWMGCSKPFGSRKSMSAMSFHALYGETRFAFAFLKFYPVAICRKVEREYREIARGAKMIRLVGHHPFEDRERKQYSGELTPERFLKIPKRIFLTFSRIQVGNQCKAFYPPDCDLPKNYWSQAVPE